MMNPKSQATKNQHQNQLYDGLGSKFFFFAFYPEKDEFVLKTR